MKPYSQFPIINLRRILHVILIIMLFSGLLLLVPWRAFAPDLTQEASVTIKIVSAVIAAAGVTLYALIIGIPYALWIRKTGLVSLRSSRALTNLYSGELKSYDVQQAPSRWNLYYIVLICIWLVLFLVFTMGFVGANRNAINNSSSTTTSTKTQ